MKTINIICPFGKVTRQTMLPLDKDGQQVKVDWWHLTPEKGGSVVCQVRGEDAVIEAMKLDPAYCWLEDVEVVEDVGIVEGISAARVSDATIVKAYLTTKGHKVMDVNKQVWVKPEDIIKAVVQLHGSKIEDYKAGGLG